MSCLYKAGQKMIHLIRMAAQGL